MHRSLVIRHSRYVLLQLLGGALNQRKFYVRMREPYQLVEYTGVEQLFRSPTMPKLLVVIVQTLPVLSELLEAVLVDVIQPADYAD